MKKLKQFLRDTSGNVAVTAAVLLFPIMLSVGAALDYTSYINMRNSVQNSIDAAGLAAANHLPTLNGEAEEVRDQLEVYAKDFFQANLDVNIPSSAYTFDLTIIPGNQGIEPPIPDRIKINSSITYDTIFGGTMFVEQIHEDIDTLISLGNRTVEVAMVLDNSGSMSGSRISTLKVEAQNLVDIVFNSAKLSTIEEPVKFSLVPFASSVNVGPDNANKNWMDKKGWSSVHHENFDWENSYYTNNSVRARSRDGRKFGFQEQISGSWKWKTRYDLFEMLGTEWSGCVEMRPWPYNTLDAYVPINQGYRQVRDAMDADNDGTGDGYDALFVPYFAPDEPDRSYAHSPGNNYTDDDRYRNDYLYDFQHVDPGSGNIVQLYAQHNPTGNYMYGKNGSTKQIERTNAVFKYQRNNQYRGGMSNYHGPNDGCTTQPITELSTEPDVVKNKITQMQATGTTNIQQGLTWGWRTLSPGEPFTGGRDNDDPRNMKMIVALTDGNNFYGSDGDSTPNQTAYGAWGYARPDTHSLVNAFNGEATHNRWAEGMTNTDLAETIYTAGQFDLTPESGSEFSLIMDAHTNQSCNNIKNDGISIFAVAFDVPQSGGVRALLQACAGSGIKDGVEVIPGGEFYFDVDQGGLADAFDNIARQIANLRIAG